MGLLNTMAFHRRDHRLNDGATNMAIDECLLLATALPVIRVYGWSNPCVTFGYFQSHHKIKAAFPNRPLTRRWTGGGAVAHGDPEECTYSLTVPSGHPLTRLRPAESYRAVHAVIAQALRDIGIEASLVTTQLPNEGHACFDHPVPGDVVIPSGQKVAGAAQRRTRHGILVQGSIRLPQTIPDKLPQALIQQFSRKTVAGPRLSPSAIKALATRKYEHADWLHRVP